MAKLFISEYKFMGKMQASKEDIAAPQEPALVVQTPVVIGAGSLQSVAFNEQTRFVRLHNDVICSVKFGDNPTATADDARLAANGTEYFGVVPGQKVAVITNA
jgi:hypothetical protein